MQQTRNSFVQHQLPMSAARKQEAVRVGKVMVLAQYGNEAFAHQKQRLLAKSYMIRETAHFVVCHKSTSEEWVLLHSFEQSELDADLICFLEHELTPLGVISSEKEFGAILFAVLASTFPSPRSQSMIWRHFSLNALLQLRQAILSTPTIPSAFSYIVPFATIYRRVFELYTGKSLLDVGCSFGFLPVLVAERDPEAFMVGCDTNLDAIRFSTDLAAHTGTSRVTFTAQDLLDETIVRLGTFETVTAIHVLEHLPECFLPVALTHLLQLTSKRLIVAVPYEQHATKSYGHEQIFDREKLEWWGQWCRERLKGEGRVWCEDVAGGMLIVDRCLPKET